MLFEIVKKNGTGHIAEALLRSVADYLDENFTQSEELLECSFDCIEVQQETTYTQAPQKQNRKSRQGPKATLFLPGRPVGVSVGLPAQAQDWEDVLGKMDAGFSETLLRLIDQTGKKDADIYKKANIDRKLFSKIRKNKDYRPSKSTALAFAIALELNLEETKDFISRAGFALSHSSKFDLIVEYFILHKNYDIFALNEVLFAFDQPLIGA